MWWQKVTSCAFVATCILFLSECACTAQTFVIKTFVPTFEAQSSLGANVSTILALRLWTTLRQRPEPNPNNLQFGTGQIEWSRRVIEGSIGAALKEATRTASNIVLWGSVEEYGPGVIVTSHLVTPSDSATAPRQRWILRMRNIDLELGLPNYSYRFSPLIISREVVEKYSRPNQIRVCAEQRLDCDGPVLGQPFRAIRLDDQFILVRQPSGTVGWAAIPNLSEAQGEIVDFTAALISYLRGDFEQAETYFSKIRDSKADSLVRDDATLLAAIANFRRGRGLDALVSYQRENPYSLFAVQALIMGHFATALSLPAGDPRKVNIADAKLLIDAYRHLFASDDPWLLNVDRFTRILN